MISARPATPADARLFFDWRNDKLVAAQSFSSDPIEFDQHKNWFESKLADPDSHLYVFQSDDRDAGQVRFDQDNDSALISYSLDAGFRGKGLATPLLQCAIDTFCRENPVVRTLIAKVKKDNTASNRVFEKLEFDLLPAQGTDNTFELTIHK
jgi:RimJ/RimL family protein N-acetyltransferase